VNRWPAARDAGRGTYNRGGGASGKARGTLSWKDTGCFNCGEVGHFADRCPKPKKQNKARLFAADVQEPDTTEDTGEQDNTAHGIMDDQDPSPESDDEGDPVDGPQYSSDEGDCWSYKQIVVVYLPTYISMHRTRVEFQVP